MSYYVFEVDTAKGDSYVVSTNVNYGAGGIGTKVGGPFTTKAQAQAFISSGNASKTVTKTVTNSYDADIGSWIVVPEGLVGDVTNALSLATKNPLGDLVGELRGDLNTGSGTTYTVLQLTSAQQAENAATANLVIYPTKALAQAAANGTNATNNPSQGASWEQGLQNLLNFVDSKNGWLRVAKIVVGSVMIIVGLAKITGADKAVTTAGKAALI
jgi:hypothetical protein